MSSNQFSYRADVFSCILVIIKVQNIMESRVNLVLWRVVTCTTIAKQQIIKHVTEEANARKNRTSVARQPSGKHTSA
jgi:hypothetical protein